VSDESVQPQALSRSSRVNHRVQKIRTRARETRREIVRIAATPTLAGIFLSFLKIGTVGFGGGLAVIAQIRALAVQQRRWLTEHEFAAGFALAQMLPGTAAGNTATYVGLKLRGWRGASVAMAGFILPSMLMMIVLAILYRHLRSLPDTDRLFHGLNAAVVALIIVTAWRMGKHALHHRWQWVLAVAACVIVSLLGATVVEVVLTAGIVGIFIDSFADKHLRKLGGLAARRRKRITARLTLARRRRRFEQTHFVGGQLMRALAEERVRKALAEDENASRETSRESKVDLKALVFFGAPVPIFVKLGLLTLIATIFFRLGAITFGGGYVMIPLLEAEVVKARQWLTHQEFADATSLGQITPGPVLITATFIGYRVAGTLGALVATISIFLPSFLMTIAAGSSLARFHTNSIVQSFLKGVTPAVVGLLIAAGLSLGKAGIHTWLGLSIAIAAAVILIRYRPNAFWVIMGAGVLRFLIGLVLNW
jgi:chromate transporter